MHYKELFVEKLQSLIKDKKCSEDLSSENKSRCLLENSMSCPIKAPLGCTLEDRSCLTINDIDEIKKQIEYYTEANNDL